MDIRRFWKQYVESLVVEIISSLVEFFLIRAVEGVTRMVAVAAFVAGVATITIWRETLSEGKVRLRQLIVPWLVGTMVISGVYVALDAWSQSRGEPPRIVVLRETKVLPATPWPTYTPFPTYTPAPPKVVTPTLTLTPTLAYGYHKVCSDAPPSPFTIGQEGYICNSDRILLRTKPSGRAGVIGSIDPDTRFVVIGGPECGDQRVWWQIQLYYNGGYHGMRGWMPESAPAGEEVFLCPWP